jgi:hypothetical protein
MQYIPYGIEPLLHPESESSQFGPVGASILRQLIGYITGMRRSAMRLLCSITLEHRTNGKFRSRVFRLNPTFLPGATGRSVDRDLPCNVTHSTCTYCKNCAGYHERAWKQFRGLVHYGDKVSSSPVASIAAEIVYNELRMSSLE